MSGWDSGPAAVMAAENIAANAIEHRRKVARELWRVLGERMQQEIYAMLPNQPVGDHCRFNIKARRWENVRLRYVHPGGQA